MLGAYGMIALMIQGYSDRLLIGSGYVIPHAMWLGAAIALDYALPMQYSKRLVQQMGSENGRNS